MNLGMQAIADDIRNSVDGIAAPDGLEGGSAEEEQEDLAADVEPAAETTLGETSGNNTGALRPASESAPKAGFDEALQTLATHGTPEQVEVVREFQRGYTQANQRVSAMEAERSDVDRMRVEVQELAEQVAARAEAQIAAEPEEELEDDLSKIPPEQQEMLQAWLKAHNYISRDELTAQERQRAAQEVITSANQRGVDRWGEDYGHYDTNGGFLVNPTTRDSLAPTFNTLVNENGLTFEDLYLIKNQERLFTEAREAGRREAQSAANTAETRRSERLQSARVAGRSTTGATDPVIYDPEREEGDIGSVFRRIRTSLAS